MKTERMLLRDSEIYPNEEVIQAVLGLDVFKIYQEFQVTITSKGFSLNMEWNYYKDGKAWLCKVSFKKKTVFWLSIWDNFFKLSFYFTEKTRLGITNLSIKEQIKYDFQNLIAKGRLIPLIIEVNQLEQLHDIKQIIQYKLSLK